MVLDVIDPVAGLKFESQRIVVSRAYQQEKFEALGLNVSIHGDHVDPSFYIGIGIQVGIEHGISAEGNVNMLSSIVQFHKVSLDEALTARIEVRAVNPVPRGHSIATSVSFYNAADELVIAAPRRSLRPDSSKKGSAGDRPPPVVTDAAALELTSHHQLTPERVVAYTNEGNAIHYEMEAANKAGFRAPIIGGGMGVHYLVAALIDLGLDTDLALDIYFRRPIFWDDAFSVGVSADKTAIALVRDGKVLTEAALRSVSDFPDGG